MQYIDIDDPAAMAAHKNRWIHNKGFLPYINSDVYDLYMQSLVDHIRYVREAGKIVGVPEQQLIVHDQSKFSDDEFFGYAQHFKGGGAPDDFSRAWLHHVNHNPHHWQYWIFSDGYTPKDSLVEDGVVEMSHKYTLEMVADWMGASRVYTGSWDMAEWLISNMPRIKLHSKTADSVRQTLDHLGYADIVYMQRFANEPESMSQ